MDQSMRQTNSYQRSSTLTEREKHYWNGTNTHCTISTRHCCTTHCTVSQLCLFAASASVLCVCMCMYLYMCVCTCMFSYDASRGVKQLDLRSKDPIGWQQYLSAVNTRKVLQKEPTLKPDPDVERVTCHYMHIHTHTNSLKCVHCQCST